MRPATLLVLAALAIAACGDDDGSGSSGDVTAVATTTQVADLVRNVGGERVAVDGILAPNSDPHDYEPRPSDAAALADADVVFSSGGELDEWLGQLVDSAGTDAPEVTLLDHVRTLPGEGGDPDPHWWQDPRNAIRAVGAIEAALTEADPGGADTYRRNAERYRGELERLDAHIAECIDRVPPGKRKIVTTHDALGYFADRYGVEVIGSVIPSLSTQAQPSAKDVEALVDQIESQGVEAVFPEAAVSQRLESAIADEAGAEVGGELWADSLGPDGSPADTYVGSMRANAAALVEGMSGGTVSCR